MTNKKVILFLLTSLLIGCLNISRNETTPTLVVFTDTLFPTNTPLKETTSLPLNTPQSTRTVKPTKTVVPFLATREAALGSCRGNPTNTIDKFIYVAYESNGKWISIICQDNGIYTKVSNASLGIVWNVPAVDNDQNIEGPEWFWEPYLWSDDGKYLYLRPKFLGFIDDLWSIYSNGYGLSRLNLDFGWLDVWLEPGDSYKFAFSGDTSLFAFTPLGMNQVIKIKNLLSGEEKILVL